MLKRRTNGPAPLAEIRTRLERLMKDVATGQIVRDAVKLEEGYHWTEFLGNYANKTRDEDAIFSTSLALNALLDTWTTRKGPVVTFDPDTTP